jgi:hypothetical protein
MKWHDGNSRRGWRARLVDSHGNGADIDAVFGDELPANNEFASLQRAVTGLRAQSIAQPAPTPSAALAQRMELGSVGERRSDVPALLPLPSRPRIVAPRVRYAIAAAVSAVVLTAGLAGAGALPSVLQDPISHALKQIGIDLPGSDSSLSSGRSNRFGSSGAHGNRPGDGETGAGTASGGGSGTGPGQNATGSTEPAIGSTTSPTEPSTTTVPPTLAPDSIVVVPSLTVELPGLPPITTPPVTLPPITVPPITLPPITLSPITLPSL